MIFFSVIFRKINFTMKIPSIKILLSGAKETFLRFPFVILTSILASFFMIYIIDGNIDAVNTYIYYKLVMTFFLGIPLLLALKLHSESMTHSVIRVYIYQLIGIAILVVFFISLGEHENFIDIARFFLLAIAFHLFVSFSVHYPENKTENFWNFNLHIFLRILVSGLYSLVLFAGLDIAIIAVDNLFDMNIKSVRHAQMFFFILGIFNTWFFLSDIPLNAREKQPYPKALKIFTQYVIYPIIIIYFLILYSYIIKILFQGQLPKGWVSYLVIGFSTAGIFSLLLMHPLTEVIGNLWIKRFARVFYYILIPPIILLFIAIFVRAGEYGITENRYFVILLALWLSGITLYNIFSKKPNIKAIPISLCIIAVLSSVGPWSAFSIAKSSQLGRFEELLIKNNILVNGKIVKAVNQPPDEDARSIQSIIEFIAERNYTNELQPWFSISLDSITKTEGSSSSFLVTNSIMKEIGVEYSNIKFNRDYFDFFVKGQLHIETGGYSHLFKLQYYIQKDTVSFNYTTKDRNINSRYDNRINGLIFIEKSDTLAYEFKEIFDLMVKSKNDTSALSIEKSKNDFSMKTIITGINGYKNNDSISFSNLQGYILIK